MPYIPDNCIVRAWKNSVKGKGKFDYPEIAGKVPAVISDNVQDLRAYFGSEHFYFRIGESF